MKIIQFMIYFLAIFLTTSCNQSQLSKDERTEKPPVKAVKKIILPKSICTQISASLEALDSVYGRSDVNSQGCSLECDWFTVCEPKCHVQKLCWRVCDNKKELLLNKQTEGIFTSIKTYVASIDTSININESTLQCSWFRVCDPVCHMENLCWLQVN